MEKGNALKKSLKIMMIEFNMTYGDSNMKMVALFDKRDITEEEANKAISMYPIGYDKRIAFMTNEQYETVFRSVKEAVKAENKNSG